MVAGGQHGQVVELRAGAEAGVAFQDGPQAHVGIAAHGGGADKEAVVLDAVAH